MKTRTMYLTSLFLLSVSAVATAEMAASSPTNAVQLRYGSAAGKAKLSIEQDISAGERKSIASRNFWMEFELADTPGALSFEITRVKGVYSAHGMDQRLPTSGMKGQSFQMQKSDDDRSLQRTESDNKLKIAVGQMIGDKFPVALPLADIMPKLPEGPVTIGSTWESTRDSRWLEAWAWTGGQLNSEHKVTGIEQQDGHTIINVTSTSHAQLVDLPGGVTFSGEGGLKRTAHWRFDASEGRLLSISVEQETSGINTLPQGEFDVRQITKVEYVTL